MHEHFDSLAVYRNKLGALGDSLKSLPKHDAHPLEAPTPNLVGSAMAKGDPSKALFIEMLTRDISLADCIVDLIDNSVDGIRQVYRRGNIPLPVTGAYKSYTVDVLFDMNEFTIMDNCGGIPLAVAMNYAFCFGRRDDDDRNLTEIGSIGLYGIGMKRSMLKMGKMINVRSSTGTESFHLPLNVPQWRVQKDLTDPKRDSWDFQLDAVVADNTDVPMGTTVTVTELYKPIAAAFAIPAFAISLFDELRRQYAFIIHQGLSLSINGKRVTALMPTFRVSEELSPMKVAETFEGVSIEVIAGLSAPPPDDDSSTATYTDGGLYGWYVVCNDRVVISADKTSLTTWGVSPVPTWHPQYYGFMGVMRFTADDPKLLPWTTTKRSVEVGSAVYKEAVRLALEATRQFVDYTNRRKSDLPHVKTVETAASVKSIYSIPSMVSLKVPVVTKKQTMRIQYDQPKEVIQAVAKALKLNKVSAKEVGIRTFDYFVKRELKD